MTNELLKLSPRAQQVLGATMVFLQLGFTRDQITTACQPTILRGVSYDLALVVTLQVDDKSFTYVVEEVSEKAYKHVNDEIIHALHVWNAASQAHREAIYQRSELVTDAVGFLRALVAKGIVPVPHLPTESA